MESRLNALQIELTAALTVSKQKDSTIAQLQSELERTHAKYAKVQDLIDPNTQLVKSLSTMLTALKEDF